MAVAKQQEQEDFSKLREAVRRVYYAAHWTPDRAVDAVELWTAVRDAAGFPSGNSPKQLPFPGIKVEYDVNRLRALGALTAKIKGESEFTSDQAKAFVLLHGKELQDRLDKTVREFMKEKL